MQDSIQRHTDLNQAQDSSIFVTRETQPNRVAVKKSGCCQQFKRLLMMMLETVRKKKWEDSVSEEIMLKRAWVVHTLYSIIKVSNYINGASTWLNGECGDEDVQCGPYNATVIDPLKKSIKMIWNVSVYVSVIMDIICYKYRKLARSFLYIEMSSSVTLMFLALEQNFKVPQFSWLMQDVNIYLIFFCGHRSDLIFSTIIVCVKNLVLNAWLYYRSSISFIIQMSVISLTYIVFCSCLSMVAIYISKLHIKMRNKNAENVKLLDGMHEGLLILSKSEMTTMFCNRPAQKLLNKYLGV